MERFNEIPPQLEALLETDDFNTAADLLKRYVKRNDQVDGVLPGPVSKLYSLLEREEPDLKGLSDMLNDARNDL